MMDCGMVAWEAYITDLGGNTDVGMRYLQRRMGDQGVSVQDLLDAAAYCGIVLGCYRTRGFWWKPGILYLQRHHHFLYVRKVGWMVELVDRRIDTVRVPFFLYLFIPQTIVIIPQTMI